MADDDKSEGTHAESVVETVTNFSLPNGTKTIRF